MWTRYIIYTHKYLAATGKIVTWKLQNYMTKQTGPQLGLHGCCRHVCTLTCAHKSGRVRVPPSICSTHCCHPPSWDKPWVTHERYLSSLSCVVIRINGTIHRRSGITTVCWREKVIPSYIHSTYIVAIGYGFNITFTVVVVQCDYSTDSST